MKLLKVFTLAILLTVSAYSNATLMLTEDNYITVDHNGTDLDWTWASNYNVNFYSEFGDLKNTLYAPTVVKGWREATTEEFNFFKTNITSVDFLNRTTGEFKNAIRFFNSDVTLTVNSQNFDSGEISGEFHDGSVMDAVFSYYASAVFDTFYVRTSGISGSSAPHPIPEPVSVLIFATAFILLQTKLRKNSA